jgi:hypothetical protein
MVWILWHASPGSLYVFVYGDHNTPHPTKMPQDVIGIYDANRRVLETPVDGPLFEQLQLQQLVMTLRHVLAITVTLPQTAFWTLMVKLC